MPNNAAPPAPVLILTRPDEGSAAFRDAVLRQVPVYVIESPLMAIRHLPVVAPAAPAGIVLTSVHGVAAAARMALPRGLRAWCVGTATARAAQAAGFDARDGGGEAAVLVPAILAAGESGPLLHVRGEHARGEVAARLTAAGVPCAEIVAYAQEERPLSAEARAALGGKRPIVLPVFSPRTADLLTTAPRPRAPVRAVAISAAAAKPLEGWLSGPVVVAARPDAPAMLAATVAAIRAAAAG